VPYRKGAAGCGLLDQFQPDTFGPLPFGIGPRQIGAIERHHNATAGRLGEVDGGN